MAPAWQRCPHCHLFFAPGADREPHRCPDCGQPLAAPAKAPSVAELLTCNFDSRHEILSEAQVVAEAANCVQCGMCSYNCPMGIDVRAHAWRGLAIRVSHCLTCSECVKRCPRGVLRFERIPLFAGKG